MEKSNCSIQACEAAALSRGWCLKHYTRWRRHGDPVEVKQIQGDDKARLMSHISRCAETGCWNWTGCTNPKGYGEMRWNGVNHPAHRVAYALLKGELSGTQTLDHLCRNRRCCNPDHLEQVDHRVNLLRGETIAARNAAVTHCPQGHEYTPENTYVRPNDSRACRICRKARREAHYARTGR